MPSNPIKTGVVHRVPGDLKSALLGNDDVLAIWNKLTPLARNEWICYITIAKTAKTRGEHLARMSGDLRKGKKRPCCWPGCPHRRPSARKWFA